MAIDKYGESPSFSIEGNRTFRSIYGTIISILVLSVAIPYGVNKFVVMKGREDTSFQSITLDSNISESEEFGHDVTNLNLMFFFTDFFVNPYSKEELQGYISNTADLITVDKLAINSEKVQT